MKIIKEKKGITLITLAVTIVVILILAGVTIDVTLGENGIINKSKEAANRMNNLVKEDEAELNELLNELNATMDSNWNSNIEIPGGNETTNTEPNPPIQTNKPICELVDNGTIKIGDYVAYTPTGARNYTVNGTYSGTGTNQVINKENLNWRVLDKTEDGKVRLISSSLTTAIVKLQGANGYNNAVYLLDELCNTLYKGTNATAKSLKIEDIQNKMNLSVWNYNNYTDYGKTYNPSYKQYPLIFAQETGQKVNGRTGSLGLSEQTSVLTGIGTASTWTVKQTYWHNHSMTVSNYIKPVYHDLFFPPVDTEIYWLSSRAVWIFNGDPLFCVRCVQPTGVKCDAVYGERDTERFNHIRPVVSLESNVQIDTEVAGKDGTSPEKAWIIK